MSLVSCVVRCHDFSNLRILELALQSLGNQQHPNIEVILVGQNLSRPQIAEFEKKSQMYFVKGLSSRTIKIVDVANPHKKDLRAKALNEGIAQATGTYLGFLDFDDVLLPHAYTFLIKRLEAKPQCVLSAGKCVIEFGSLVNSAFHVRETVAGFAWAKGISDFYSENFLPIQSYLIAKNRVRQEDLIFDEDMDFLEDYAFLLKLSSKYDFDWGGLNNEVARYRSFDEILATNPSMQTNDLSPEQRTRKERGEAKVKALKQRLPARMTIAEIEKLVPARVKVSPLRSAVTTRLNQFPSLKEKVVWIAGIFGIKPRKY